MNSHQILSKHITFQRDTNHSLPYIKYQNNIYKQKESIDNSGSTKIFSNRINNLFKIRNESNENLSRIIKKPTHLQSIRYGSFENLSNLIEKSLKQIDEYRFKFEKSLVEQNSIKHSIENNSLLKFPQKPKIPNELIGKLNENNLENFIFNSNLNKTDDLNTLIGRYELISSINPKENIYNKNEINENFSLNIFEYIDEYWKYFNRLLDEYFSKNIFYENFQSKLNCLALCEQIKDFFKKFSQRYKIIVQIYIQQHFDQSILIASRSLWDKTFDQFLEKKIAGLNPSDSNPYSSIKDSNINVVGMSQECNSLVNANPWRNPYSNPYVYDAATAVALVGYSPYAAGYSPHMDLAGRRKNATRETTATLKAWLYEHRKNPYPTKSEKVYLAIMTKMTLTQVSTWFANARRRLKKENKMTWSPRNRTNDDDDDDRQGGESNSSQSDDESNSPLIQTNQIPSSSSTTQTSFHYLSPPLTILQHHQIQQQNLQTEETNQKRKLNDNQMLERKKRCGIWSLADMAEKNHNNKINQLNHQKQEEQRRSSSISSSSSCSSPTSSQEKGQTLVGAFKPFK